MNYLSDLITYVRRIIKSPSDAVITDALIIDYINRFYLNDMDARIQLFDLKTKYQFQTTPGWDQYNMPMYDVQTQPGDQLIANFPVYQGFMSPAFVNGIEIPFYTQRTDFFNLWPNYVQSLAPAAYGTGVAGSYQISLPYFPAIPGHVSISGIIDTGANVDPPISSTFNNAIAVSSTFSAVYFTTMDDTGANLVVADSGQFLNGNQGYGLLMRPGNAPYGNQGLNNTYGPYSITNNTVNYATGIANITFTAADGSEAIIPAGTPINAQCYFWNQGIPRSLLFYNNTITVRPPPDIQYLVELDAYLTPAAFLNSANAIPFGYMSEYIARGAARKILSDTGDMDQFAFYEPLFKEQETLVWKRSQRQFTSTRTQTIFSDSQGFGGGFGGNSGQGV